MADEVKTIEELNGLVTELRKQHEKSLEGVVFKSDFKQFEEKIGTDIQGLLEKIETAANRTETTAPEQKEAGGPASEKAAFLQYLRKGKDALTPEQIKGLATDTDTTGGYLTSPTISSQIVRDITEMSPIRQYANVETIGGNAWTQPVRTGGFACGWTTERGTRSETAAGTLGMQTIPLYEMYAEPAATQTMLDDGTFDVEGWISAEVAEIFASTESTAFVSGSGVGQPTGFMTDANITHVASGVADAITTDGMRKCIYGVKGAYLTNAAFFMRRATVLSLMLLTDGEGQYLWKPGLVERAPSTFDGYPVVLCPDMPAIAAGAFPVIFGDMRRGYKIIDKPTVAMLRDPYTSKGSVLFYTTKRVGGDVDRAEALIKLEIAAS